MVVFVSTLPSSPSYFVSSVPRWPPVHLALLEARRRLHDPAWPRTRRGSRAVSIGASSPNQRTLQLTCALRACTKLASLARGADAASLARTPRLSHLGAKGYGRTDHAALQLLPSGRQTLPAFRGPVQQTAGKRRQTPVDPRDVARRTGRTVEHRSVQGARVARAVGRYQGYR